MSSSPAPERADRSETPSVPAGASPAQQHPAEEWFESAEGDDGDDTDFDDPGYLYDPSVSGGEEYHDFDPEQELFDDPELHLGNVHIEFEMDDASVGAGGTEARVSPTQLLNLLASNGLRHIFRYSRWHGGTIDIEEDDETGYNTYRYRRRRRQRSLEELYPKVPSEAGTRLMASGDFGNNSYYVDDLKKRKQRLVTKLMWRELGIGTVSARRRAAQSVFQDLIPGTAADRIIHYDSRCYSGQFSDDGNFFFSCAQDFKVRMYDTSNPYEWKYYKTVDYPYGQWTITDASLSPDNRFLAYSSIRSSVCLASTDPADSSDPILLDLSASGGARRGRGSFSGFGIWSIRFSGDGRELVAGTSNESVVVYDIEKRQPILRLQNHKEDVNAVCFGDVASPHILYSGSDDTTIRVWDRRSMGDGREAGAFLGHTEGLTYVDSKGDGRYVLSNSKDQTMKLWDLRKMMTTAQLDSIDITKYSTGFDYRFESYEYDEYEPHEHDCSVVTFRGHRVLKTLIRCHFSPPGSSNSRYVYTGSEDGKVYVYNLDATLAGTIDISHATLNSRPRDSEFFNTAYEMRSRGSHMDWLTCVRDASWHPNAPIVAATSWNGWGLSTGTCSVHSWNDGVEADEGDPPLGKCFDSKLRAMPQVSPGGGPRSRGLRSRPVQQQRGIPPDPEDVGW